MIRRLLGGFLMLRAARASASGNLKSSNKIIRKLSAMYGDDKPGINTPIVATILYAENCSRLSDSKSALGAISGAIDQIYCNSIKGNFNSEELLYLQFRAIWTFNLASEQEVTGKYLVFDGKLARPEEIRLDKVSKYLRRMFPMTIGQMEEVAAFIAGQR